MSLKTLIIGIGNPLRQDDGLGAAAAAQLEVRLASASIQVMHCHQLVPELAETLAQAELAIFIDACVEGEPGTLTSKTLTPLDSDSRYTHSADPAVLLGSAHHLYGRAPRAWLFTLTGADFVYSEALSPTVANALPHLIDAVIACLKCEGAL